MDAETWSRIDRAFAAALELAPTEREAFLLQLSGEDAALGAQLRRLLAADATDDTPLERPIQQALDAALVALDDQWIGRRIGAWRIVSRIASGGMGAVFLAERDDAAFQQQVAIKLMGAHLPDADARARFRFERQILAAMQHPYIARLLDGGTLDDDGADDAAPYLVMEYVVGEAITDWCERRALGLADRLLLFRKVCAAVDYAHRNLVVHRDLKPGNILVDAQGDPRLLDFGIAKLIDEGNDTATRTVARMTPDYASPEQLLGQPVTTASDVYALGVMLYELIAGRRPYSLTGLRPTEVERLVCETGPARPSQVLHGRRPGQRLPPDLDAIVLKALRPDPQDRYASALALSQDLERHLAGLPVEARGRSWRYAAGKFLRRHRAGVAVAAGVLILIGAAATQVVLQRNRAEAQAALAQRMSGFLVTLLASANPYEREGEVDARTLLDRGTIQIDRELGDQPQVAASLKLTMARAYRSLGQLTTADALADAAIATLATLPAAQSTLADAHAVAATIDLDRQFFADALAQTEAALALLHGSDGDNRRTLAEAQLVRGRARIALDAPQDGLADLRSAVGLLQAAFGDDDAATVNARSELALALDGMGQYDEARALADGVVAWQRVHRGENAIGVAEALRVLGNIQWDQGDFASALPTYARQLDIMQSVLGPDHPALVDALATLGRAERKIGREPDAKRHYEQAIALLEASDAPPLGKLADLYGNLGTIAHDMGDIETAEPLMLQALVLAEQAYGQGNAATAYRVMHVGALYRTQGRYDLARGYFQRAIDAARSRYPDSHHTVLVTRLQAAINEAQSGRRREARTLLLGVMADVQTHLSADHPLVGQILLELAENDVALQEYARAVDELARSEAIYRRHREPTHPDLTLIYRIRAEALQGLGQTEAAVAASNEADRLAAADPRLQASDSEQK